MKVTIDKDRLYCNDVSIISSAILEVELISNNGECVKSDVTVEIQDYYEISTDTNFNIIDDVVEKFEYSVECANIELSKYLKSDFYDNYRNSSIACDVINELDVLYDNKNNYESVVITNVKDFSYIVEEFKVSDM